MAGRMAADFIRPGLQLVVVAPVPLLLVGLTGDDLPPLMCARDSMLPNPLDRTWRSRKRGSRGSLSGRTRDGGLRSDDLLEEFIRLGPKPLGEACPEEIRLLGQALDFTGRMFGRPECEQMDKP
jgi:hypothetical protein